VLALSVASAGLAAGAGGVAAQEPCAATMLRPQPCPLWHTPRPVLDPAIEFPAQVGTRGLARNATSAALVAASLVTAVLLDHAAREHLAADDPSDPAGISRLGNALGNGRIALAVTGTTYGVASLAGYDELADPAGRVLASLITAGIANGVLKASLGRARPGLELGSSEFRPFVLENGWQSFPSGHTTTAFALATAISAESDRTWVTALTYSAATLVAWSRSHEDQHWMSDVVGGALIGTLAARYTARRLDRRDRAREPAPSAGIRLLLGADAIGVSFPLP
jgi:membrane-associated phospholipid phosphatase